MNFRAVEVHCNRRGRASLRAVELATFMLAISAGDPVAALIIGGPSIAIPGFARVVTAWHQREITGSRAVVAVGAPDRGAEKEEEEERDTKLRHAGERRVLRQATQSRDVRNEEKVLTVWSQSLNESAEVRQGCVP